MINAFKRKLGSNARPSLARDYLVFSALIIAGLLLLCGITAWILYSHRQQQLETTLYTETQQVERTFTEVLHDIKNSADFLAERASNIGFDNKDTLSKLFARTDTIDVEMQSIYSWIVFEWVPAGAQPSGNSKSKTPITYPLQQAKATPWQLQFADIMTERDIQEYKVIPVAYGVADEKGTYRGAIVAKIPLEHLQRFIDKNVPDRSISYAILDHNLEPVAASDASANIPRDTLREHFDGTQLAAKLPSPLKTGNVSYTYFQKSSYPFIVVSGYDEARLTTRFWQEMLPYLLLSLVLGIFFLSVLYAFRRYTISPVIHLADVASQIRLGMRRIEVREFGPSGRQKKLYPPEIHILRIALLRNIRDKERDRRRQEQLHEANIELAEKTRELNVMKNELERVLELSEESDKIKNKVIARIRYNTRNAINNIPIITQLLIRNLRDELDMRLTPEKQEQLLKILEEQAEHISAFTTDDLEKEQLDPITLIKECVSFHAKQAHKRGITIGFTPTGKLPKIWADRDRLTQIMVGLIYRSMDFLPRDGHVEITASVKENKARQQLVITIRDDGFGWNEEERQKALSQHDAENFSRNVDGMDLSVNSIRKLLILHSGSVVFEDVWEKGSVITVTLPYIEPGELVESPSLPENVIPLDRAKGKK